MPSKKLQKQQNKETDSLTNEQDQEGDELFQSSDIKIASKENENDQKDIPVTVLEIKIKEEPMEVVQSEALEDDEEISVISPIHTKKRLFILEDDEEDSEGKSKQTVYYYLEKKN